MSDSSGAVGSGNTGQPRMQMLRIMVLIEPSVQPDFPSPLEKPGWLPASKGSIDAMPRIQVTAAGSECAICLEAFEVGGELREMPCNHGFHSGCIENWLNMHGSCPICRFIMPAEEGDGSDAGEGKGRV
ncbi:E3 ubiquitin-protein ligase RING1-like [Carica papaya]|uniref:E3 ubiquitin-protein ligase RING1-like n=1 Tax=Carica papaya TaxID=3649 RepID=UPI000B8C8FBE|nr:E3 ubiquitin-protein ligase RING1-like [Carica papaya]